MILRCDKCKHWTQERTVGHYGYRAVAELGECTKAVQLWDATEWASQDVDNPDSYTIRGIKPDLADQMSFVQDGSDYMASLWTKPQFFCAHFEGKE
jgi:hypothetical protein